MKSHLVAAPKSGLRPEYAPDSSRGNSYPASGDTSLVDPHLTTFAKELQLLRDRISARHNNDTKVWDELEPWKKLALSIIERFSLNKKQRLAFLLKVHDRMTTSSDPGRKPYRLIIGGPGGMGKSHIYEALRAFYDEIGASHELNFTAPTGVSASNVSGSTIHFELGLRRKQDGLKKVNAKSLEDIAARMSLTKTLIVDEFFFLGCSDWELTSRNINSARNCHDGDPFGNLDLILSGDEYQLTGPGVSPLYDQQLVSIHTSKSSAQCLNANLRLNLRAVQNYWTITECVVLDEIVRQRNKRYVEMLGRLRRGVCTVDGDENDLDFLRQFQLDSSDCVADPDLTNVLWWLTNPRLAAPLVTYTNFVRNDHNWWSAQAFAASTGQQFAVYYAQDSVGRSSKKIVLTGQNAQDAWNTPIKSLATDLSGRLPLIIGMPVYLVDNFAVELGISKGSGGTLISVKYELKGNKRYAISAVIDLPSYTSSDPDAPYPHRLTVWPIMRGIKYRRSGSKKLNPATRQQLPLIPGFGFTAHNSQSRSLDSTVVHLGSCSTTASAYVMLSRIKCGKELPTRLGILGEIEAEVITNHAPEQVRREEKRLKRLAKGTLARAKGTLSWYITVTGDGFD